ncbi:alpha/beta fold hydrolase [Phenylobacterium terrae]|uniref:Alpha/beta fold hydrolase n=1 Tax=Phenylobacterium terrae TaxID=2665495 RepID=A0ABW4NA40_9CAUL
MPPHDPVLHVAGRGEPALLFVHGAACDHTDWAPQMAALSNAHRVAALDLPGHGAAPAPAVADVGALAAAVTAAKAGLGGPVVLVGHSLGCRVVLEAYHQAPADVRGIVLVDANLLAPPGQGEAARRAMEARIETLGVSHYLAAVFEQMFVEGANPALRSRIVERASRWDPAVARSVLLDIVRWDSEAAERVLRSVRVPLLMVQSTARDERSRRVSLKPGQTTPWTALIQRLAPGADLRIVENVGHFPQLEAPGAVADAISGFCTKLH